MNWPELFPSLNIIPIRLSVIFPNLANSLRLPKDLGKALYDQCGKNSNFAIALAFKGNEKSLSDQWTPDDCFKVGVLVKIDYVEESGDDIEFKVRNLERIVLESWEGDGFLFSGKFNTLSDEVDLDESAQRVYINTLQSLASEILSMLEGMDKVESKIQEFNELGPLLNYISQHLNLSRIEKQEILSLSSIKERTLKVLDELVKHRENIRLQMELADKVSEQAGKIHRENILREQLRVIQGELGDSRGKNGKSLLDRINKAELPENVYSAALEEFEKLESIGTGSPDAHIIQNYLDLILKLPWNKVDTAELDLERSRNILNRDHYGLKDVKERIIQHLAVLKKKKDKLGSILLLVGPPGIGKTSLGKSIAEALDRPFVRVSLGGVKDESEIRGHRRTYVGAMPGRILNAMKKAGSKNPVFILDEIDKISHTYNGDPASALLEVLDPEQNDSFSDHYLELPFDLSQVFFIATANSLEGIPGPLLDRMERITLSGYTDLEKEHIAIEHLLPKVLADHGLESEEISLSTQVIREVISRFTREAGVRGLKRKLESLARYATEKIVSGKVDTPYEMKSDELDSALGKEAYKPDIAGMDNPPGVVTGLAWTPVGGDILFIEVNQMEGKGGLTLTGKLGDVMKESAQIALSLTRSLGIQKKLAFPHTERDLHIHVPSGAVPKDGPSAGITIVTSMVSLFLGKKVDPKMAMTGEITLRGTVLPVGGIKEKVIAAHRSGIKKVLLPSENEKDLKEIPDEVSKDVEFILVSTVHDVLKHALDMTLKTEDMEFLYPNPKQSSFQRT